MDTQYDTGFNPGEHGYMPNRVAMFGDNGWIVNHDELPTLVIESNTGWFCVLPSVYESEWMPIARAMLG